MRIGYPKNLLKLQRECNQKLKTGVDKQPELGYNEGMKERIKSSTGAARLGLRVTEWAPLNWSRKARIKSH